MGTGLAIAGGASLLGAGANLIAAGDQAGATERATNASLGFQREALDFQRTNADRSYNFLTSELEKERQRSEPLRQIQLRALSGLEALTDPNSAAAEAERAVGTKAIQRTLSAQGMVRSGAQGAGLAALETGLARNRQTMLQALAGINPADNSTALVGAIGNNFANTGSLVGSSLNNMGSTVASGMTSAAQARASGLSGLNNSLQTGVGNAFQLMLMSRLFPQAA